MRWPSSVTRTTRWPARLEGELVVSGLHDARRAGQVGPVLARLAVASASRLRSRRWRSLRAWRRFLAGRPCGRNGPTAGGGARAAAAARLRTGTRARRCCGCWSRRERYDAVEEALAALLARCIAPVQRAALSRRTALSACSSCDSARCQKPTPRRGSRCGVLQEGDFAPGLGVRGDGAG